MKKLYLILLIWITSVSLSFGQTINMTGGTGSSSVTASCAGATFNDNGGTLSGYSNNMNSFLTICPATAGTYISVNFTSFSTFNGNDVLIIFDGNTSSAGIIGIYSGGTSPGTVTATNPSGCLSFRFVSNASNTTAGWTSVVTCSATPGSSSQLTPTSADCGGGQGTTLCSDASFGANSSGEGDIDELLNPNGSIYSWAGCLNDGEHRTSWYYWRATTGGTMEFTITPTTFVDYDWAIWGPSNTALPCPAFLGTTPIRCSYAAGSCTVAAGSTGLLAGNVDVSEAAGPCGAVTTTSAGVNAFCAPLPLIAGQYYVMCIDNFTNNTVSFTIDFNLTGGATLDCTPLPVELESFNGKAKETFNQLYWSTSSEINNSYFVIEKSEDGISWTELGRQQGAGNSNSLKYYSMVDPIPYKMTYYRLSQTDLNGDVVPYQAIVIQRGDNGSSIGDIFGFYPNPAKQMVNVQTFYEGENKLTIRDQAGKDIFQTIINGKTIQTINLDNNIGSGLYFITIENGGLIQNEKIIITQ